MLLADDRVVLAVPDLEPGQLSVLPAPSNHGGIFVLPSEVRNDINIGERDNLSRPRSDHILITETRVALLHKDVVGVDCDGGAGMGRLLAYNLSFLAEPP